MISEKKELKLIKYRCISVIYTAKNRSPIAKELPSFHTFNYRLNLPTEAFIFKWLNEKTIFA